MRSCSQFAGHQAARGGKMRAAATIDWDGFEIGGIRRVTELTLASVDILKLSFGLPGEPVDSLLFSVPKKLHVHP